ncbi:DUF421 domain-containing protein [Alkalicoccus halolimnae]|uniref:YetF domain-containing protein n=1 Tax=Alkalicoccus halolimnae TaxID=1667239 RepID=A0A5C7FLA7_9BACI|nr:YetF domain-containing protein [Alkalicoccus halolimnae]TXF86889.1 DUF421 domain-containing protein [Alkalicoccus halolimnae]
MFFDDWQGIYRTIIIAFCVYPLLILMLRISGKRTLSKMNMFDFIITIALGSTVATILLDANIAYAEGMTAIAMLILLQFLATWLSVHAAFFNSLIKGEPRLLFYEGTFMDGAMKKERIKEDEIKQAVRTNGHVSLNTVQAVVLETDGSLSVMGKSESSSESVLPSEK